MATRNAERAEGGVSEAPSGRQIPKFLPQKNCLPNLLVDLFNASSVAYRYYDEMGQLKCKVATDCHSSKPGELFLTTEKRRKRIF